MCSPHGGCRGPSLPNWARWHPPLLDEIRIVGKLGCTIIVIGREVERFPKKHGAGGRGVYSVPHYCGQASGYIRAEAEKAGFASLERSALQNDGWPGELPEAGRRLAFVYKKRFQEIQEDLAAQG